jgi:hypothetical protein
MSIHWRKKDMFFDTLWEAEEWAKSIADEFHGRIVTGYIIFDYKVAYSLAFYLATIPNFHVHTKVDSENNKLIYKIWGEWSK